MKKKKGYDSTFLNKVVKFRPLDSMLGVLYAEYDTSCVACDGVRMLE